MAEKQGMTIEYLLEQFYSDLIMVKRDSEKTADTYKISAEEFLKWLVSERIKLKSVNIIIPLDLQKCLVGANVEWQY